MSFVHLHTHFETSYMDGTIRLDRGAKIADELGQKALAITDHGTLAGTYKHFLACNKAGIKPILGVETYLAIGSRFDHRYRVEDGKQKRYEHLTLLAKNRAGWENLVTLQAAAHESYWYKPRIDFDLLSEHSEGLICMTGCLAGPYLGELAKVPGAKALATDFKAELAKVREKHDLPKASLEELIARLATIETDTAKSAGSKAMALLDARGGKDRAVANLKRLRDIFGEENLVVELMEHGIEKESTIVPLAASIASEHGIRCVATGDAHYEKEGDAAMHDAWLALSTGAGARLDNKDRLVFDGEGYFLCSESQMRAKRSEDFWGRAVSNTAEVASMIDEDVLPERKLYLPAFPTPKGKTEKEYLVEKVKAGAKKHYGAKLPDEVRARLNRELKVIDQMGMCSYFLIVEDVISWAKSEVSAKDWIAGKRNKKSKTPILVGPGRGSVGGCLLAYCLGIHDTDSLRSDLMFERFIDPSRVGMPDVDTDFEKERRDEILDFLVLRWGAGHVLQLGTLSTRGVKDAIDSGARLLGITVKDAATLKEQVVDNMTIEELLDKKVIEGKGFRNALNALSRRADTDKWMELSKFFYGLVRGEGIHACGVVISDQDLTKMVPTRLNRGSTARDGAPPVSEWEGKDIENLGLLKQDVLGLRTLDIIGTCLTQASRLEGEKITINDLPDPDAPEASPAWELLAKGDNAGVFQVESASARDLTRAVSPTCLEHICAINALNRPGPMMAGQHELYAKLVTSGDKADISDLAGTKDQIRAVESILGSTQNLAIYQEQSMLIGKVIGGFDNSGVNLLRHAISKKNKEEFAELTPRFLEGAQQKISEDGKEKVSFSHSQAAAIWHLVEGGANYSFNKSHSAAYGMLTYRCAYLKAVYPAPFTAAALIHTDLPDKRRSLLEDLQGVEASAPDINDSALLPSAKDNGTVLLGLGDIKGLKKGAKKLLKARSGVPFESMEDFLTRAKPTKTQLDALTEAGALDRFGARRDTNPVEKWVAELGRLGIVLSAENPLSVYVDQVRSFVADNPPNQAVPAISRLGGLSLGAHRSIGICEAVETKRIKSGLMATFTVSNRQGDREKIIAWPKAFENPMTRLSEVKPGTIAVFNLLVKNGFLGSGKDYFTDRATIFRPEEEQ